MHQVYLQLLLLHHIIIIIITKTPLFHQIPATAQEPFYLAEVVDNDIIDEVLTVRWYAPTNCSKSCSQTNYHQMNFEVELSAVGQSKGRQNG